MQPNSVLLPMFLAGVLAGTSAAILVSLRRDLPASLRHLRRMLREGRHKK